MNKSAKYYNFRIKLFLFLVFVFFNNLSYSQNSWQAIGYFPDGPRELSQGFKIGKFIFVGFGYQNGIVKRDLYKYDVLNSSWDSIQLPNNNYVAALFNINEKGYFLDSENNLFEIDTINFTWMQKQSFPGVSRENAYSFSIGDSAFIFGGNTLINPPTGTADIYSSSSNLFWSYNQVLNSWHLIDTLDFIPLWSSPSQIYVSGSTAFSDNNFGYFAGGQYESFCCPGFFNAFYKFNPQNKQWIELPDLPENTLARRPTAFNFKDTIYLEVKNINESFTKFYFLDNLNNQWNRLGAINDSIAEGGGIAFPVDTAFLLFNRNNLNPDKVWKFHGHSVLSSTRNVNKLNSLIFAPNPCTNICFIDNFFETEIYFVQLFTHQGELVKSYNFYGEKKLELDISNLAAGLYFVRVNSIFQSHLTILKN